MLLVDDDEAQARHRGEDRQSRAEDQIGQPQVGGQPAAQALRRRQPAVEGDDVASREAFRKAALELRREVDLGHEDECLAAGIEGAGGRPQVDLRLAASGDPVQQHRRGARAARSLSASASASRTAA